MHRSWLFIICQCVMRTHSIPGCHSTICLDTANGCVRKTSGKLDIGMNCTSSSDCITGYCVNFRCSCPSDLYYNSCSGTCSEKNSFNISSEEVPFNSTYRWNITSSMNTYITLIVTEIDLYPYDCILNYVNITENNTTILARTCSQNDSTMRVFASNNNTMYIGHASAFRGFRGFKGIFIIRNKNSVLTDTFGYIVTPGYPAGYPIFANCSWRISGKTGQTIVLSILTVSLESSYDFISVYNGSNSLSPLYKRLNASDTLTTLRGTKDMFITFTSDISVAYQGFLASYILQGKVYGDICSATDRCSDGFICTGVCTCPSGQYYDSSTQLCRKRLSHGERCSSSATCLSHLTCVTDRNSTSRCLCRNSMYEYQGSCYPVSQIRATIPTDYYVSTNFVYLKWSTSTLRPDITYSLVWASRQNGPGVMNTKSNEMFISSLKPQTTYNFTITSSLPADNFYFEKSAQTTFTVDTMPLDLTSCVDDTQCSNTTQCVGGTCVGRNPENCSADGDLKQEKKDDTTHIVVIAVSAAGWAVALAAIIAVVIVCARNRHGAASNSSGGPVGYNLNSPATAQDNDYKKGFPKSTQGKKQDRPSQETAQRAAAESDNVYMNKEEVMPAAAGSVHVNRTFELDSQVDEQNYDVVMPQDHDEIYQNSYVMG